MKSIGLLLPAVALLMVGCSKSGEMMKSDEKTEPKSTELTITASVGDEKTKTTLEDGGTDVYWEPGDEIKVFYGNGSGHFVSGNTELAKITEFTGSIDVVIGGYEKFPEGKEMWGLYPYRPDATCDGSSVTTTLPDFQNGKAGSFAKNTNLTLAKSSNLAMAFYNVCGGICFTLTRSDIANVVLEGRNGENLAGTVKLGFEEEVPAVKSVEKGKKAITLTASGGGTFAAGTRYYIVALPETLDNGFKLTFNTATHYAVLTDSKSRIIKRGSFGLLENVDAGLTFIEGSEPRTGNIEFKDSVAKYACVAKFDLNGDYELSYAEAAEVTDIQGLFDSRKTVKSFDEFKYFTSLKEIPEYVFENCSSLKSVTLPVNVTSIPDCSFKGCSSLESVTMDSKLITKIGSKAFFGCTSLSSFEFFSGLMIIGNSAFENCTSLHSVNVPNSVISLGSSVFSGCTSLVAATLPSGLTVIPSGTFHNCFYLDDFSFPESTTMIQGGAFHYCSLAKDGVSKIEIPSGVTFIGEYNFERVRNVLFNPKSFVSIMKSQPTFGTHTKLYFPSDLVDMYKTDDNWSEHAEYIFSTGEYAGDSAPIGTVDMGMDVFWSTCNLGAADPQDYGDYYAFAEIEPYYDELGHWKEGKDGGYIQTNYKWWSSTEGWIKYYADNDGLRSVEKADDAASQILGGKFCLPSYSEWEMLLSLCKFEWVMIDGHQGCEISSPFTGKSFFLPASGYRSAVDIFGLEDSGLYWYSDVYCFYYSIPSVCAIGLSDVICAEMNDLKVKNGDIYLWNYRAEPKRYYGLPIRPVSY